MSDSGWWQASDGKWYPPESRPAAQSPVTTAGLLPAVLADGAIKLIEVRLDEAAIW